MFPLPIHQLIQAFSHLPGVGPRTAERFVFHLLKSGKKETAELTVALKHLIERVKSCERCWDFSDKNPCRRCVDATRESTRICVVTEPQHMVILDQTGEYRGLYHLIRGSITPHEDDPLKGLKISELLLRVKTETLTEIILALNPDVPGETTMMFLEKQIHDLRPDLVITRLARGLPMGSDLQYADDITLSNALRHRLVTTH